MLRILEWDQGRKGDDSVWECIVGQKFWGNHRQEHVALSLRMVKKSL